MDERPTLEIIAPTVEEALARGLEQLGLTAADVSVEVLDAGTKGLFWVASSEQAAREIYAAIQARRPHAYITRRWRLIAWLMRLIPESLYAKI